MGTASITEHLTPTRPFLQHFCTGSHSNLGTVREASTVVTLILRRTKPGVQKFLPNKIACALNLCMAYLCTYLPYKSILRASSRSCSSLDSQGTLALGAGCTPNASPTEIAEGGHVAHTAASLLVVTVHRSSCSPSQGMKGYSSSPGHISPLKIL